MRGFLLLASTALAIATTWMTGCGGSSSSTQTTSTPITTTPTAVVTVYAAGSSLRGTTQAATLWKNGTATQFGTPGLLSRAYGLAVAGADVYVVGPQFDSSNSRAVPTVWKNGVASTLPLASSLYAIPQDVVITSSGDLYVAGVVTSPYNGAIEGVLWKNGVPTYVDAMHDVYGMVVEGSDVYLVGDVALGAGTSNSVTAAAYWKNGVVTVVDPNATVPSVGVGIAVSGKDVYLAGYWLPSGQAPASALLWKNGARTALSTLNSVAYDVKVSGTDVLVPGVIFPPNRATVWKNGNAMDLSGSNSAGTAVAVAVANGSIYAAGQSTQGPTIWKDGVASYLANGDTDGGVARLVLTTQ